MIFLVLVQFIYSKSSDYKCNFTKLIIDNDTHTIDDYQFFNCSDEGELYIPCNVTYIGKYAFYGCSGLTGNLIIPDQVTYIGEYAFSKCSGFTGNLNIPNSITFISNNAFSYCKFNGTLNIPDGVTNIGEYSFYKCFGFKGSLVIPNSVTLIGRNSFSYCTGFNESLILSNQLIDISDETFLECFQESVKCHHNCIANYNNVYITN